MKSYSKLEQLIIFIIIILPLAIMKVITDKKDKKREQEEQARKYEENKKKKEEGYKKFLEDKSNIANTIDQSIYSRVDFKDDEDVEKIVRWLNSCVIPKLVTPQYKQSMKDEIIEYFELLKQEGVNNLKVNIPTVKAEAEYDDIIRLLDEDQEINTACHFVCDDIADILYKAFDGEYSVGTGDGDEGCIYIHYV